LSLIEVEPRKRLEGADLRRAEAELILAAIPDRASVIALDERGKSPDSKAFSADLCARRDSGISDLAFVIGGADGLDPSIRQRADRLIALGAMTWPHLLVRALVAEQVYRAITIAAGHPYHRE
jgi:23S rRNA (pseudouridine1915-N3)-methyltransferase